MPYVTQEEYDRLIEWASANAHLTKYEYCAKCQEETLCLKPKQTRWLLRYRHPDCRVCLKCGWRLPKNQGTSAALRDRVRAADNYTCVYCGSTENLTTDHLTPQSWGGKNTIDNCVTACKSRNSRKRDNRVRLTPRYGRYSKQ